MQWLRNWLRRFTRDGTEERALSFALAVVEILESEPKWTERTCVRIAMEAILRDLGSTDAYGRFDRTRRTRRLASRVPRTESVQEKQP